MAISTAFEGSEAVTSARHSLTTDLPGTGTETSDGIFQVWLDVSDLGSGDELEIRIYEQVRTGLPQRVCYQSNLVGPQSPAIWVSPSLILVNFWDVTVRMVSGAATINWSIRKVA